MSISFQSFPNEVLALIVGFASNQSREISAILECILSKNNDDFPHNVESIFQALCQSYAPNRQSLFPAYSWKKKFAILSEWLPREGVYVLLEAAPWGMLLSLSMDRDSFVGDLLWPQPDDDSQIATSASNNNEESSTTFQRIRALNVSFDADGQVDRVVLLRKLKNGVHISALKESEVVKPAIIPGCPENVSQSQSTLRITIEDQNFALPPMFVNPEDVDVDNLESDRELQLRFLQAQWHPEAEAQGCDLLQYLWQYNPVFTLDMIKMSDFPHMLNRNIELPLIDGLYSGVYENMYGKFRREIIMVEYHRYDIETDNLDEVWEDVHAQMFNAPDQSDDNNLFQSLKDAVEMTPNTKELIFMLGRKVTGDYHVPMLKTSFGALLHPKISFNVESRLPEIVRDQEDPQQEHNVARSWDGWGTLARPYFQGPHWARGSLLQFTNDLVDENTSSRQEQRFGFAWSDDDRPQVTILTKI